MFKYQATQIKVIKLIKYIYIYIYIYILFDNEITETLSPIN